MNFSELIENGSYKEEDLTPEEKAYVEGMRRALECMRYYVADFEDAEKVLDKIRAEIIAEFADELEMYIKSYIDEFIVCIQDERAE
jgi:hypothetical protein